MKSPNRSFTSLIQNSFRMNCSTVSSGGCKWMTLPWNRSNVCRQSMAAEAQTPTNCSCSHGRCFSCPAVPCSPDLEKCWMVSQLIFEKAKTTFKTPKRYKSDKREQEIRTGREQWTESPEIDTIPWMWLSRKEESSPRPAGNTPPNTAQGIISLFYSKGHCWVMVNLVDHRAFSAQLPPMVVSEIVLHQQQNLAISSAEIGEVHAGLFLQPLDGSTTLWFLSHSSECYITCCLLKEHSVIQVNSENVTRTGPHIPGVLQLLLVLAQLWANECHPLSLALQLVSNPFSGLSSDDPLTWTTLLSNSFSWWMRWLSLDTEQPPRREKAIQRISEDCNWKTQR